MLIERATVHAWFGAGGEGNSPNPASDENGDTFLWRGKRQSRKGSNGKRAAGLPLQAFCTISAKFWQK